MASKAKRPVVVTTEHRGVFFGDLDGEDAESKVITLTGAQMCVYWTTDVQGVVGLAVTGPSKGSRVTPAAPKITLQGVTSVMDATKEAAEAWRARPWR